MAGYARQSSADIVATAVVRANPLNVEFNALRDTFALATGHTHDGSATEGGYVPLIADSDALNKIAIDTSNNRVGIFVEVSNAAVEQIRIQDGAIVPVTDSDIDLGTSSLEFKDLFLDGTAHIDTLDVDANAGIIGNLTVSGNTTLGDAASDTVTVTADVASPLIPSTDDTYDLGASGSEWRNLYIDGTANIDALVADTADINGGTADGVVIGGSSAAAGTFTSLTATGTSTLTTVDINGGAIDGAIIGANSAAAITGTTITGTSLVGAVTGDVTGNADTATALETARTIGGVSFDGTGNINLPGVNATGNQATSGNAATATALETARTIGGVSFDGTGNINLPGVNASGNQDTSGNATTATTLATARTIAGQSFNGSANITIAATDLSDTDQSLATGDNVQFAQVTTTGNAIVGGNLTVNGTTTTINSSNMTVDDQLIELGNGRSGSASGDAGIVIERGSDANAFIGFDESADKFIVGTGTFTGASTGDLTITTGTLVANIEGNVTGAVTGNASTATALATARTIAGQSFDGTGNISIAPTDLTGVNSTATELNIMDGDTSATSTTLADADRVVVNDDGTMKQVALTDFETYMETSLDTLSNVTTVGALNSGSITSGFGAIDVGSSAITTTGTINFGSLADGSITATGFVDEDNMSSNSATLIPTQQSVKAYVDSINGISNNVTGLNATGAELNTVADFSAVSVDTSTAIANNDALLVFDNGNEIGYRDVDLLDTYFSGTTKTLTNKTLTSPIVTGMHLNDSGFTVEGSGADGNDTTVAFTNPTADRTITLPDATGNLAVFATAPTAAITDGSSGQFLKTDGSGVLSFADVTPAGSHTATATGAIAIRDAVGLTSSGTVSKIQAVGSTFQSEVTINDSDYRVETIAYDSGNSKLLVVASDRDNGYYPTAYVGSISGDTVSWNSTGTVVYSYAGYHTEHKVRYLSSNKFIVMYHKYDLGDTNRTWGLKVGTISGTSVSFGSETALSFPTNQSPSYGTGDVRIVVDTDDTGNFVIVYGGYSDDTTSSNPAAIYAAAGSVSGTTITLGPNFLVSETPSGVTLASTVHTLILGLSYDTTANKFLVGYGGAINNGSDRFPAYRTLTLGGTGNRTITGGTIVQPGFTSSSDNDSTDISPESTGLGDEIVYMSSINRHLAIYRRGGSSNRRPTFRILDVSGSSVTSPAQANVDLFGVNELKHGNSIYYNESVVSDGNVAYFVHMSGSSGDLTENYPIIYPITVPSSGNTITKGSSINPGLAYVQSNYATQAMVALGNSRFVYAYWNEGTGIDEQRSKLFSYSAVGETPANFLGFAAAAISSGSSGTIKIIGGVITGLSGLTAGSTYYVTTAGALQTTNNGFKVGRALTSSSILVDTALSAAEMNTYLGSLV